MENGQSGLSGHHVQTFVKSQEPENVTIHLLKMEAKSAQD